MLEPSKNGVADGKTKKVFYWLTLDMLKLIKFNKKLLKWKKKKRRCSKNKDLLKFKMLSLP